MGVIIYWRWVANLVIFLIVVAILLVFDLGLLPTYKSGFYCNDPTLAFVPGEEKISSSLLFSVIIIVPVFTLSFVELLRHSRNSECCSMSRFLKIMDPVCLWLLGYFQGLGVGLILTEIIKFIAGNPRPTFLAVCTPDKAVNCTTGDYIQDYECTNENYSPRTVLDNNRSFLSGHSETSLFMGLYLFWYLQRRCGGPRLWAVLLQLLALVWAVLASLSRISDHRHHWWDVVCGAVLGALMAIYAVKELCDDFIYDSTKPSEFFKFLEDKLCSTKKTNENREFIASNVDV